MINCAQTNSPRALRKRPGLTSRFEIKPENPRSHALRGNGSCAAPRCAYRQLREVVSDQFLKGFCVTVGRDVRTWW